MPAESKAQQQAMAERRITAYRREARWRKNNPEKYRMHQRNHDARHRYGFASYEAMCKARDRACEICGQKAKKMCIDHSGPPRQFDGTYRGILCHQCNTRLGWFEKHQSRIAAYLQKEPGCPQ